MFQVIRRTGRLDRKIVRMTRTVVRVGWNTLRASRSVAEAAPGRERGADMADATLFLTPPDAGARLAPAQEVTTRYPAYRPSGVVWLGDVPAHWEVKRLKHLCTRSALYGANESAESYQSEGVRFLRTSDIDDEGNLAPAETSAVYLDPTRVTDYMLSDGDLLLSRSGTLGRSFIYNAETHGPCAYAGYLVRFVLRKTLNPRFAFYFTKTKPFEQWIGLAAIAATIGNINGQKFANIELPLPPLPEQEAIAAWLNERTRRVDELVAANRRLIDLLAEQRTALITHAVTKGLNPAAPMKPSGIDWLGDVPAEVRRLKFLSSFVTSGSRGWAEYYSNDGEVFLRIGNVSRVGVDLDLGDIQRVTPPDGAEGERTIVQGGDVLISVTAYIGAVGVVPEGFERAYVNQHLALVRPRRNRIEPRYLAYALFSGLGQIQFRQLMYGGTKEGLGLEDVKNLLVIVPSLDEQRAIVAHLDAACARFDSLTAAAESAIVRLTEYRQAFISAAVTGKISVCGAASTVQPEAASASDPVIAGRINGEAGGTGRTANKYFQRSVLAAEIIARIGNGRTFGRVKLQKALILAEGHLQLAEIESQPMRAAAGPFDNAMMRSIQSQLQKSQWYEYRKDGDPLKFLPLAKAGGHKQYFDRYWGAKEAAFAALMDLLVKLDTQRSEIVATLYSAWNDFLIDQKPVTDDALVAEVLTNWDPAKTAIPQDKWRKAIGWMRGKGLVPTGYGAHTRIAQHDRSKE